MPTLPGLERDVHARFVANLAEARKATEKLAAGLVKRGWVRPEVKPIGMERKEDAFDLNSLPAPSSRKK
jgi:hypothetical protein